jgi:hypothetical protein
MQTEFVIVECDVDMQWTGPFPRYRVYLNNELFAERTWIWNNVYLVEMLQIQAPPGDYKIRYELLDPELATLSVSKAKVIQGPCHVNPRGELQIYPSEL